ncbi:HIT-like domain-containing protein [Biscogniauxia mediterranea]|nr:HIT-like domain-containing protein [Biscogniauxia mediterranea]
MIKKGGIALLNCAPLVSQTYFRAHLRRTMTSSSSSRLTTMTGPIYFGPYEVTKQVFLTTPHSFALVNLKPLLPGHVLVCPSRPHRRLTDLPAGEVADLFVAVQRVQRMLARHYFSPPSSSSSSQAVEAATPEAGSFNLAVQDGPGAGQTVPHVHVHVIPRIRGATAKQRRGGDDDPGDAIYELMAAEDGNVGGALWDRDRRPEPGGGFPRIEDQDRKPRSMAEMEAEADVYREVLRRMEEEEDDDYEEGGGGGGGGGAVTDGQV